MLHIVLFIDLFLYGIPSVQNRNECCILPCSQADIHACLVLTSTSISPALLLKVRVRALMYFNHSGYKLQHHPLTHLSEILMIEVLLFEARISKFQCSRTSFFPKPCNWHFCWTQTCQLTIEAFGHFFRSWSWKTFVACVGLRLAKAVTLKHSLLNKQASAYQHPHFKVLAFTFRGRLNDERKKLLCICIKVYSGTLNTCSSAIFSSL
jgi:hypothetical protein